MAECPPAKQKDHEGTGVAFALAKDMPATRSRFDPLVIRLTEQNAFAFERMPKMEFPPQKLLIEFQV